MFDDEAQILLNQLIKKTANVPQGKDIPTSRFLKQVLDNTVFEFTPAYSAASMASGTMYLGIDKYYLQQAKLPQKISLAHGFFHELGHLVLPLIGLTQQSLDVAFKHYGKNRQDDYLQIDVEAILKDHHPNYSIFHNHTIQSFYDKLGNSYLEDEKNSSFSLNSTNEAHLLNTYSEKLRCIFHEQFAECLSVCMIKRLYPTEFNEFVIHNFNDREMTQKHYAHYADDYRESSDTLNDEGEIIEHYNVGYVHRVANAMQDTVTTINNNPESIHTFSDMLNTILPIVHKNLALEMKDVMERDKTMVYYGLNELIAPKDIMGKIEAMREGLQKNNNQLKN